MYPDDNESIMLWPFILDFMSLTVDKVFCSTYSSQVLSRHEIAQAVKSTWSLSAKRCHDVKLTINQQLSCLHQRDTGLIKKKETLNTANNALAHDSSR